MSSMPHPSAALIQTLEGIRRRVKAFAVTYGAGLAVSTAMGLLLLIVLLDWTLNLPTPARLVLILLALGAFGFAAARWIIRPLRSKLTLSDVAGRLENAFPQFDDRLRSTVNFLGETEIPGSEPMKRRVVEQANELVGRFKLEEAVTTKPAWYSVAGGIGAVAFVAVLAGLLGPNFLKIAANRLALGDAHWPKRVELSLVGTMPKRVPVGKPVEVKIRDLKGKATKAVIYYRYDENSSWQKELMTAAADGTYAASIDTKLAADQSKGQLFIKLEAGDDEKVLEPVAVLPRLDIARIEARVTPPPYAKAPPLTVDLGERPGVMAVGSGVELTVAFNKPLSKTENVSVELAKADQKAPQINWKRAGDATAVGSFAARENLRFVVRATDEDGFQNTGTQEYELIVREDAMPTVQIEEPRRSEDRTPVAAFPLKVVAEDDYGIARAELVVTRLNGEKGADGKPVANSIAKQQWTLDLVNGETLADNTNWSPAEGSAERKRFRLEHLWSLDALLNANLKPGDLLEYFVQVKDNFQLDGKDHDWVPSGKLRVTIISKEQMEKQDLAAAEQLHNEIAQIKRNVLTNKTETEQLAKLTEAAGKFEAADEKQAERLSNEQATSAQQTKQTSGKLQQLLERMKQNKTNEQSLQPAADQASQQLEQTAEGVMKDANKNLTQAKDQKADPKASPEQQKKNAQERNAQLAKAQDNQQQAADQLEQAMQKLGNFDGLSQFIERLEQIRKEQQDLTKKFQEKMQQDLGKRPDQLPKDKQDELKKMSDEQKKLAEKTEKAIQDMQKQAEQKPQNDPSAQALKQSAQTGQQQQVPSKQQQASQKMQQNQQAGAQMQQQEVQIGIEMMLKVLKDAERRKLEELEKRLAELQKLVGELVRRQAGHNIDNLTLDDIKKFTAMTEDARKELLELAERDLANMPPPPTLQQLSASQEQTERNTRDVAKQAEALPDPAPSAKLTAAAGQMERAIVHLRANELAKAYDPPQVEALRALVDAKEKIDKALAEARKQLQQQDQETIKQAYVKILEEQKKLDKETTDIDKTKAAAADGNLPREHAVRLGQLPGVQGGLSERVEKLGKELEKIGSIVYVWANKDIGETMGQVKDKLAKPETGQIVQAEQTRIEEQLQAMIDSLKETPKKSPFDAKGGGGQCKTKMPSEAELRLLKALQTAINTSTTKVNEQPKKDEKTLLGLGTRQGDVRNLLDKVMRESSGGKVSVGEEPDNKDQLPEEAKVEDIENQELLDNLIKGEITDDNVGNSVKLTGDRMARSRQRLAVNNDPGKVTQVIQKRILDDLDVLIEASRRQIANSTKPGQQGNKPGQKQPGAKPGAGQQGQQQAGAGNKPGMKPGTSSGGMTPAGDSSLNGADRAEAELAKDIKERMAEWGGLTPREREAVMEGASDKPIKKYERLVEDYYRELAKKATQR